MIIINQRQHPTLPDHVDGDISMSQKEWDAFQKITEAPYRPRTIGEFNAMCDLAAARHAANARVELDRDPAAGAREIMACTTADAIKFGADGEVNLTRLVSANTEAATANAPPAGQRPKLTIV